jgi:hypothetical protein
MVGDIIRGQDLVALYDQCYTSLECVIPILSFVTSENQHSDNQY